MYLVSAGMVEDLFLLIRKDGEPGDGTQVSGVPTCASPCQECSGHACQWRMEHPQDCSEDKIGAGLSNAAVWDPCENPGIKSNHWNPFHGLDGKALVLMF